MAQRIGYMNPDRGYVRVKTGFSWPAFFFGGFWAAAKGLWLPFVAMGVADTLLWFASGYAGTRGNELPALLMLLVQLGYWIWRGRLANAWWREKLLAQGYVPVGAQ